MLGVHWKCTQTVFSFSRNSFQGNAADFGGAVDVWWNSTLVFIRNIFRNNSVHNGPGGALYADVNNSIIFLENIFENNRAGFGEQHSDTI